MIVLKMDITIGQYKVMQMYKYASLLYTSRSHKSQYD
jgi:hypothetical protein